MATTRVPSPERRRRNDLLRLVAGIAATLVLLALQTVEIWDFSRRQIGITQEEVDGTLRVAEVRPESPADRAGLHAGDRIRKVGGITVDSIADMRGAAPIFRSQAVVPIEIDRGGSLIYIDVIPGSGFPVGTWLFTAFTVALYLAIGPLAMLKRPGYLRARLLNLLTLLVAIEIAFPGAWLAPTAWLISGVLLNGLQMAVELHLASVIPETQGWLKRWPWALRGYYVLGIGSSLIVAAAILSYRLLGEDAVPWSDTGVYSLYTRITFPLWVGGVLFLLGRQALTYPEPKGRQQALIVLLGGIPWAVVAIGGELGLLESWVPSRWTDVVWNIALLSYPLAVLLILWREAGDQERILLELTEEVKRVGSVGEISRIVSLDLHAAFHPKSNHVFYRERHSRDLTLGHSTGMVLREEVIPESSPLLRLVEAYGKAVDYPEDLQGLPPGEREWLERLEARLIVPLAGQDGKLLGLLVLGEKKSEEPYTPRDRRLLQSLTSQIALFYENVRLKDSVRQSQVVQREVLSQLAGRDIGLVKECPTCGLCYDATEETCTEDGSQLGYTLPVERTIARRFRLDRLIDKGGMGNIYRATDLHLSRVVAVKILNAGLVGEEGARRFESEARITSNLRHPNVVTVFDYGTTDTGAPYLVMELLEGFTLRQAMQDRGKLPPALVADWLDQACEGVGSAHRAHVIHRDLKPANIFVARQEDGGEVVKILDFGIAKVKTAVLQGASQLTQPGALLGTFAYMAPEQLEGGDVDERSDVFSLGVMAVEALTGRRPFPGDSPTEILGSMFRGELRLSLEGVPGQRLEAVLGRCLARDAAARTPSIAELRRDLVPAIRGLEPATQGA